MAANAKRAALAMFPDKPAFDLIYKPACSASERTLPPALSKWSFEQKFQRSARRRTHCRMNMVPQVRARSLGANLG
jgi:hypothetical protein